MRKESEIREEIEMRERMARQHFAESKSHPHVIVQSYKLDLADRGAMYVDALLWVVGEQRSFHDELFGEEATSLADSQCTS